VILSHAVSKGPGCGAVWVGDLIRNGNGTEEIRTEHDVMSCFAGGQISVFC